MEGPTKKEPTKKEPTKKEPTKKEPTKREPTKKELTKREPEARAEAKPEDRRPDIPDDFSGPVTMDVKKMEFTLSVWTEEEIRGVAEDEIMEKGNTTFLRALLKLFPHFRFSTNAADDADEDGGDDGDGDSDGDEGSGKGGDGKDGSKGKNERDKIREANFVRIDSVCISVAYCMLKHGKTQSYATAFEREVFIVDPKRRHPLGPALCLVADMCNLSYPMCKCNKRLLYKKETACPQCVQDALPKPVPGEGCGYIFARGENKGKQCGKPVVPGSNRCNACMFKLSTAGGPIGIPFLPPPGMAIPLPNAGRGPTIIAGIPWGPAPTPLPPRKYKDELP